MIKNRYNVIGVMSGTSLDGLDLAHCTFTYTHTWEFKIREAETWSYSPDWRDKLRNLVTLKPSELKQLDKGYTHFLGETISQFIDKHQLTHLDAVCSHGHTALHQPQDKLTYQIGNLPELATFLNQTVVCDFRVEDVALGGQGAPLVPIGDRLLFGQYGYCLNLGGFANISFEHNGQRIAYDICPVNIILNRYVASLGFDYDEGGRIAASGTINMALLEQLNALPFYTRKHPKSLGLEWVQLNVIPLIDAFTLDTKDILRTLVEHIAIQIANEIKSNGNTAVLVTGGGAFNTFLMHCLSRHTKADIVLPETSIIEFKEALIFGFLGVLKLRNEVNCLRSVTGAKRDHSSGKIYYS